MSAVTIKTRFVHPPIPVRCFDWCAYVDGDEESGRYGWGATEAEATAALADEQREMEESEE